MAASEDQKGNPPVEDKKPINDSFDSIDQFEDSITEGSKGDEFFNALDKQVNGAILDDNIPEATRQQTSDPEQATHSTQTDGSNTWDNDENPYKKRYSDSSREAVNLKGQLKELEPFVPVLEAMKNDSGLVNHVRDYLENGGQPAKSIQEKLNLDEDFMFDQQEAMADPESDSARLMNAHVDSIVQKRVGSMIGAEKERAQQIQQAQARKSEEKAFMEKNNMSDEQFSEFKSRAENHRMTLDDVNHILNRDQVAQNTANATKNDMLNQMKNVRNMPTSASGVNSVGKPAKSQDDNVFDAMLGMDADLDNLFG